MKKFSFQHSLTTWLILAAALVLFSGPAQANVYDGFSSTGISTSLWFDGGPNSGLFSQPGDGYLYFSDTIGGKTDKLRSSNRVSGAFFVAMQYSNFQATNSMPGTGFYSSCVELVVSTDLNNSMVVVEGKNADNQFFQAVSNVNNVKTHLDAPILTSVTSGWLGMGYSGGQATFWYDSGAGWTQLATYATNFTQDPSFLIVGYDPNGTALSFQVDQVQLSLGSQSPVPLPPSIFMLGSGLLGLAGLRRRFKRN